MGGVERRAGPPGGFLYGFKAAMEWWGPLLKGRWGLGLNEAILGLKMTNYANFGANKGKIGGLKWEFGG